MGSQSEQLPPERAFQWATRVVESQDEGETETDLSVHVVHRVLTRVALRTSRAAGLSTDQAPSSIWWGVAMTLAAFRWETEERDEETVPPFLQIYAPRFVAADIRRAAGLYYSEGYWQPRCRAQASLDSPSTAGPHGSPLVDLIEAPLDRQLERRVGTFERALRIVGLRHPEKAETLRRHVLGGETLSDIGASHGISREGSRQRALAAAEMVERQLRRFALQGDTAAELVATID